MFDMALQYWVDTFTTVLKDETDDALKMNIIKRAPFQDDPVLKAPYLIINVDEPGIVPEALKSGADSHFYYQEIGGSQWWLMHLHLRAAPKTAKTQTRAYYLVNLLTQRIVWTIRKYALEIVPADQGNALMQNRDWNLFKAIHPKVSGGEGEWLSHVDIHFVCRIVETGPFPYGAFAADFETT